jgi:hypothetical protein
MRGSRGLYEVAYWYSYSNLNMLEIVGEGAWERLST